MIIENQYLYNFTEEEKDVFAKEQKDIVAHNELYRAYIQEAIKNSLECFIANNPRPFTRLEVKYHINRLALNDPLLTSLHFNEGDPVDGNSDAISISKALATNTHCKELELEHCGFTDSGCALILDQLKSRQLNRLSLRGNHLSVRTFQRIQSMTEEKSNQWGKVDLGEIVISNALDQKLSKNSKITYKRKKLPSRFMGFPFFRSHEA